MAMRIIAVGDSRDATEEDKEAHTAPWYVPRSGVAVAPSGNTLARRRSDPAPPEGSLPSPAEEKPPLNTPVPRESTRPSTRTRMLSGAPPKPKSSSPPHGPATSLAPARRSSPPPDPALDPEPSAPKPGGLLGSAPPKPRTMSERPSTLTADLEAAEVMLPPVAPIAAEAEGDTAVSRPADRPPPLPPPLESETESAPGAGGDASLERPSSPPRVSAGPPAASVASALQDMIEPARSDTDALPRSSLVEAGHADEELVLDLLPDSDDAPALRAPPPKRSLPSPPRRSLPTPPASPGDATEAEAGPEVSRIPGDSEAEAAALPDTEETGNGASKPRGAPPRPPKRQGPAVGDASRKRLRNPWWEDLFSEDFARALNPPTALEVSKDVDFIENALGLKRDGVILDLGCGSGHHSVELATRGYGVVGFDLSVFQLALAGELAQERGQRINFLQGDMREMAFEETFDGVICWNTTFGYFEEEKNIGIAQRIFRALRPGGMFLLDVINRDYVAAHEPCQEWFDGDSCVCMDDPSVDYITSRIRIKRSLILDDGRTRECVYSVRLYSLHELGKLLHDVGFRVCQASGHPTTPGAFFGPYSPRIIVLAQRP